MLATKGQAHKLVKSNSVSQVIVAPKTKHSKKPNEARDKIVELVGDMPRIELFARNDGSKDLFNRNPLYEIHVFLLGLSSQLLKKNPILFFFYYRGEIWSFLRSATKTFIL